MFLSSVLPRFSFNRLHCAVAGVVKNSPSSVAKTASRVAGVCLLVGALAACGGGSGPDRTPNSFSFTAQNNVELGTQVASPAVTITSISNNTPISITGGEYSLNGGAFTSAAGTIDNNQTLSVRATASDAFDTANTVTVTVGSVTASFVATTLAQDITPNAVSFTAITNAALSAEQTSNAITVEGINDAAPISIANGQYSINGGDFTAEAGTVEAGSSVVVQLLTSATFNTASTATLTVGELESAFSATTLLEDTTPDAISFAPATDAEFNAVVTSATQTISGINSPAAISIAGGQYKINDNAFTSEAGTVNAGDVVVVSVVAGDTIDSETSATLTVGDINGVFSATTIGDTTPPVAEVFFPTPTTFTDGENVTIRGAATDDFGPISQIRFTVSAGETTNEPVILQAAEGESLDTWMESVPLITGQANTIRIQAIDAAGNEQVDAVELSITQGNERVAFPVGSDFSSEHYSDSLRLVYDIKNNRTIEIGDGIVSRFGINNHKRLFTTDLKTGLRSVFLEFGEGNIISTDQAAFNIIIDPTDEGFLILALENQVYRINIETKNVSELIVGTNSFKLNSYFTKRSESSFYFANLNRDVALAFYDFSEGEVTNVDIPFEPTPDMNDTFLDFRFGFTADIETGILYGFSNSESIFSVDLSLPEEEQVKENKLGDLFSSDAEVGDASSFNILSIDKKRNRFLMAESVENIILEVDLITLASNVIVNTTDKLVGANALLNPQSLHVLDDNVAIIYEDGTETGITTINDSAITLYLMDLDTHERVVLSRSLTPAE